MVYIMVKVADVWNFSTIVAWTLEGESFWFYLKQLTLNCERVGITDLKSFTHKDSVFM